MKKITKALSIGVLSAAILVSSMLVTGCNFSVEYKEFSDRLNEAIAYVEGNENFQEGYVKVGSTAYKCNVLPKLDDNFVADIGYYTEVNQIYDAMFSYTMQYIKDNATILQTPPTVETLTEVQENLYRTLVDETKKYKEGVDKFSDDIANINRYYKDTSHYGITSKEIFVVNYKKAYREFIYECFNLANVIEDITASVYTKIDYAEDKDREGQTFKVLEHGINIRIFEGFFSFIVDSFDCRVPTKNVDANEYMIELLDTYAHAKSQFVNYYKSMKGSSKVVQLSAEEIASIQDTMVIYFAETGLYQKAYDDLNFVRFYFNDDCNLQRYINNDYANKNRYAKIYDYINNTLPNLTNYITSIFF